ncbi:MAG: SRPBCC family protein [Gammaproteobacteria bacterium]|nr:SRPBCC family protein [Gammaproteobacteria bacterium]
MLIALGIIGGLILLAMIYLASLDGDYAIRRSLKIDAPVDEVFACIRDFKTWPEWSPWLLHEADTKIDYSDDYQQEGGFYSWDGKLTGAGKLTHVKIYPGKSIHQDIEFTRPFKSLNQVNWYFEDTDGSTTISWEMIGSVPFLFRFMRQNIEPMISKDYDLGLNLLKGYLRPESTHLVVLFCGRETLESFQYWSIPFSGNLRELQASRKSSLGSLQAIAGKGGGLGLSLYREINWQQIHYSGEVAIPVSKSSSTTIYTTRQFTGGEYYKVEARGDHEFLPLAWYAAFTHCRMHKIKLDKSRRSLEIYRDDPKLVDDSNQIRTILYLPVKK